MNNTNNFDVEKFWPGAEEMLDRHFRRKRIISWLLIFLVPAFIAGLAVLYSADPFDAFERNEPGLSDVKSGIQNPKDNFDTGDNTQMPANEERTTLTAKEEGENSAELASGSKAAAAEETTFITNKSTKAGSSPTPHRRPDGDASITAGTPDMRREKTSDIAAHAQAETAGETETVVLTSDRSEKGNTGEHLFENENQSQFQPQPQFQPVAESSMAPGYLTPLQPYIEFSQADADLRQTAGVSQVKFLSAGLEVTVYGSANYLSKTLSAGNENTNYFLHRKNEEKSVTLPGFGVSVTASRNLFSFSIGAEYNFYGEKTVYYPYSLQEVITTHGNWQTYIVNYLDTDTAYVTGNQYFYETFRSREDSVYNSVSDTTVQYLYDKEIAEKNGVNSISYVEFPVEIGYHVKKGKLGIGVSGGISPGWLTGQRGYYLRKDGRGIEALREIESFRKFMLNARFSVDFYYRIGGRTKLVFRPQYRTNLNSVFDDDYGVKQKYSSTGIVFGISYLLN